MTQNGLSTTRNQASLDKVQRSSELLSIVSLSIAAYSKAKKNDDVDELKYRVYKTLEEYYYDKYVK